MLQLSSKESRSTGNSSTHESGWIILKRGYAGQNTQGRVHFFQTNEWTSVCGHQKWTKNEMNKIRFLQEKDFSLKKRCKRCLMNKSNLSKNDNDV